MKVNVYKAKKNKNLDSILKELKNKMYFEVGTKEFKKESIKMFLYAESHRMQPPEWVKVIWEYFDKKFTEGDYDKINAVIIVQTKKSIYFVPKGSAFHQIRDFSDLDFGLDFAERTVNSKDIILKNVNYILRSKMSEVSSYKEEMVEFPQASESYSFLSAKPEKQKYFGNNIDCGVGVAFSKNFSLLHTNCEFVELFNNIDYEMHGNENKKSSIPRFMRVGKNERKILDDRALEVILNSDEQEKLAINIDRIQVDGNQLSISSNIEEMYIYINGKKKETREQVELDGYSIQTYIKKWKNKINSLNELKFQFINEDGESTKGEMYFANLMYFEVEYDEQQYVLQNGGWGYFNKHFYDLIEERLQVIDENIFFEDIYSKSYVSANDGVLSGEGGYIEELTKNDANFIKLHRRNIKSEENIIEVADVYKKDSDELIAIKRGTNTSTAMYSFEQSLLSVQVLKNKDDFKVKDNLMRYNYLSDSHEEIPERTVNEIIRCKDVSVLWLVDEHPKYVYNGVSNKSFSLTEFKSLMLKLKIIDWYLFAKENDFNPKLYFALDKPVVK